MMKDNGRMITVVGLALVARGPEVACGEVVEVFTADTTTQMASDMGLRTCQLSVQFDDLDSDSVASIGFADMATDDPQGFFQVPPPFGTDTAPIEGLITLFPELHIDSFVTIQYEVVPGLVLQQSPRWSGRPLCQWPGPSRSVYCWSGVHGEWISEPVLVCGLFP